MNKTVLIITHKTESFVRDIAIHTAKYGAKIILYGPKPKKADFGLKIFNPDGSEAEKSGNGLRIFCKFLYDYGFAKNKEFTVETPGGLVKAIIVGEENNALMAARRLSVWVYLNLDKMPVLTIPSAIEVLKTRVGDCNEHATLLTALLRASGIPAKLSIGLTYSRGQFFYHAWTEAYVGEWISVDATLNQLPVDATHIKLVEGNLDKQVAIAGLIGKLELKVLDFKESYK